MLEANKPSKRLLQVGAIALVGVGLCYMLGTTFSLLIGPAPSGAQEYMTAISAHKLLSIGNFALFALADILLVPSTMALYVKFRGVNQKAMIAASALMLAFVVFDFAVTEWSSLQLVGLTQTYATATGDTQRIATIATANSLLSTLPLNTLLSFVVSSLGVLVIAWVMLKGGFSRRTAILGIVIGIVGTLGGFYIFVPALSLLLSPSMFAFGIWGVIVGRKIYKIK